MPEAVLNSCSKTSSTSPEAIDDEIRRKCLETARSMALDGLRVLAVAYDGYFAGLVGISDPPRPGVAESVLQLRSGGVKCFMITGDAKETAIAIARRCNLLDNEPMKDDSITSSDVEFGSDPSMSGSEIEELDATADLASAITNGVRVFYRVSPHHKLKIVRARTFHSDFLLIG